MYFQEAGGGRGQRGGMQNRRTQRAHRPTLSPRSSAAPSRNRSRAWPRLGRQRGRPRLAQLEPRHALITLAAPPRPHFRHCPRMRQPRPEPLPWPLPPRPSAAVQRLQARLAHLKVCLSPRLKPAAVFTQRWVCKASARPRLGLGMGPSVAAARLSAASLRLQRPGPHRALPGPYASRGRIPAECRGVAARMRAGPGRAHNK